MLKSRKKNSLLPSSNAWFEDGPADHLIEPRWMYFRSGIQQRRISFEDGVAGTTCPIPPGANFTYLLQAKDQIGTYFYFPSLAFHKAAGGFGGIRVLSRPMIPVPFPPPAADYTILIGDWYKANHTVRHLANQINMLWFNTAWLVSYNLTRTLFFVLGFSHTGLEVHARQRQGARLP